MQITISGKDKKRLQQVEDLAKSLGLTISKKQLLKEKKKEATIEALKELRKMGTFKDIKDPIAWQKEQRKDRNIVRDE
ncbi:hypothetical protein [Flavobacterium sp. CS20]|uniref:hypothetical protein n=1 Tax=Flavobacterium sp. CS20 TaxID=2775246 RepID=UPI001B3A6FC1|nr:hypothetical protein [Flavobacterium sp. CS20]QTY26839.1 hypothetical protein IGB25_13350 [Flavobacterium sp. CS20]